MMKAVSAKFKQHKDARNVLLQTGDASLVAQSRGDSCWFAGKNGNGPNKLGKILMLVRDKLLRKGYTVDMEEEEEEESEAEESEEEVKGKKKKGSLKAKKKEKEQKEKKKRKKEQQRLKRKRNSGLEKTTVRGDLCKAEYASSGRSKCRVCMDAIPKDEIRLAKLAFSRKFGLLPEWHHVDCFFLRHELPVEEASAIREMDKLRWNDQQMLLKRITDEVSGSAENKKEQDDSPVSTKKRRTSSSSQMEKREDQPSNLQENVDKEEKKKEKEEETDHDKGKDKEKEEAEEEEVSTEQVALDQEVQIQNEKWWYIKDNLRRHCKKKEIQELLALNNQPTTGSLQRLLDRCAEGMLFGALPKCTLCGNGDLYTTNNKNGAREFRCNGHLSAWSKCTWRGFEVERLDWIMPEESRVAFLRDFRFDRRKQILRQGKEPSQGEESQESPSDALTPTKRKRSERTTMPRKRTKKVMIKGNSAVDPESGLHENGHIYEEDGTSYNAVLNMADISLGLNFYYKLQLIETDDKKEWYLWRKWGKLGTFVGGKKITPCESLEDAKEKFETAFEEKTHNSWDNRRPDLFVKKPGKYHVVDVNYSLDGLSDEEGEGSEEDPTLTEEEKQLLEDSRLKDLMQLIFNIEAMEDTLAEMEIDTQKMPLGRLSKATILAGYQVLSQIHDILQDKGNCSTGLDKQTQLIDCTNQFYTVIPHSFGRKTKPVVIDSEYLLKQKIKMLDALSDMEVAVRLLKQNKNETIPSYYKRLNTRIVPVDDEQELDLVRTYIRHTHAPTHSNYELELLDLYRIEREGEQEQYDEFCKDIDNKMLLWHGSRLTNFVGILSQGLRIAPPEAPVTGYMFGKGVYFADMVSKSANYCRATEEQNVGLAILAEVALGNMYERSHAEYMESPPAGFHSTKGIGQTRPDPHQSITLQSGVVVPIGTPSSPSSSSSYSSLLYNEYIVYDVRQVHIKYLCKLKFHYH
ncbi:Poly [ADP-ribose] polymerase 1, variant 2 [Balamuthia mandrillaris]